MADTPVHCHRPLWKRPPFWFVIIAAVLALGIGIAMEEAARRAPMPYGAFLDQLEAGNIASVTFRGTQIDGSLKHALGDAASNSAAQKNTFRSHVPDFGDPTLLAELRKQHVAIDVASSSSWTRLLAGIPLPMLLFLGFIAVAAIVRFMRGGKAVRLRHAHASDARNDRTDFGLVWQAAESHRFTDPRRRRAEERLKFETTFDRKTADFALALGTFYCRHLQHPIMATIEREGVVYAQVYNLRGGPTPQLLTMPPP